MYARKGKILATKQCEPLCKGEKGSVSKGRGKLSTYCTPPPRGGGTFDLILHGGILFGEVSLQRLKKSAGWLPVQLVNDTPPPHPPGNDIALGLKSGPSSIPPPLALQNV